MIYKLLIVFLLSTFEIYAAIATALAFKLSPHVICTTTFIGGFVGVFLAAFLGDQIKAFISNLRKPKVQTQVKASAKEKIFKELWHKYGVFGVGFLGTFFLGGPAAIGVGYGFGVSGKQLLKWSLIAVTIRSVLFSYFFDFMVHIF